VSVCTCPRDELAGGKFKEDTMRARFIAGLTAVVALLVAIPSLTPLLASGACGDSSLNGSYAFRVDGTGGGMFAGPFAAVGKNTYDGKGGMRGEIVISTNGNVIPTTYTGTYSVDASCTATKSATLANGLVVEFYFVIDSNRRALQMIVTRIGGEAGHTISGGARKMLNRSQEQGTRRQ
jgi:hypothetical protein